MDVGLDIGTSIQIQVDAFWYGVLEMVAGIHWGVQRAVILTGYTIELLNQWLVEQAFAPLIAATNASLTVAVTFAFAVAMLLLGITYLLAVFVRLNVVEFRSALLWYLAGLLFFAAGPAFYQGMTDFRREVSQAFYLSALNGLQGSMGGAFSSLSSVDTDELAIFTPCDNLGSYLPTSSGSIDGLDVALAYLRADGIDVMGYQPPVMDLACPAHPADANGLYTAKSLPYNWTLPGSYFDNTIQGPLFPILDEIQRDEAIQRASDAQKRLLMAWPLLLFGINEQLVYLLLTIAQGLTFLSFGAAILFAFFKKTEIIARSIVDLWIELIVQTVVIALVQSLVVNFFLMGTATGSGMVVAGIGLICMIFMLIVLWSGVKAVWNSFNRLFNAMGQATGETVISVGSATKTAAGAVAGGAGLALGGTAAVLAGMQALNRGATTAQAAGVALGGSQTFSGAARTLAYLPGIRGTSLGDAAEQFTEGSITREIAGNIPVVGRVAGPLVGAMLLTDRHPDHAEYDQQGRMVNRPMLVPAVGEGLERYTVPAGAEGARRPQAPEFIEGEDGEMLPVLPPRRTGYFTPAQEQGEADRQGEELEQHISDTLHASTGTTSTLGSLLQQDNSQINNAATQLQMVAGQLQLRGSEHVASVVGDVVETSQERELDFLTTSDRMAQVMNVTPLDNGRPAVREDLPQFGLFINQALRMGLNGQQAEQVVREVQESPQGNLSTGTQELLVTQLRTQQGYSHDTARNEVNWLQHTASTLPTQITAVGMMPVPTPQVTVNVDLPQPDSYDQAMKDESAMGGSGGVIGGSND